MDIAITDIITVDIVNTMANNSEASRPASSPRSPSAWGAALVAGLIGILLLGVAVPRLLAASQGLNAREVVWALYAGAKVAPATLTQASADLAAADTWVRDGEREGERSLLLIHRAMLAPTADEQAALWTKAEAAAASALSIAPGQPSLWYRLAALRERHGDLSGAVAALRLSMLSGAYAPDLMAPRIELGLKLVSAMNQETRDLLKRQIRLSWAATPGSIVALSAKPDAGPLVREALDELSDAELLQFQHLHAPKRDPAPGLTP
jgi:hypothetical protein